MNAYVNQRLRHSGYLQDVGLSATGYFLPRAHFLVVQIRNACMKRYMIIHSCQMIHIDSKCCRKSKKDYQSFPSDLQFLQNISLLNQEI